MARGWMTCDKCHNPIHDEDARTKVSIYVEAGKGPYGGLVGHGGTAALDLCLSCSLAFTDFLRPVFAAQADFVATAIASPDWPS